MLEKRKALGRQPKGQGGGQSDGGETVFQFHYATVRVPCQGLYSIPNVHASEAEARRWAHADLADLPDFQLWQEIERVRLALVWCDNPGALAWLKDRWAALQSQKAARNG